MAEMSIDHDETKDHSEDSAGSSAEADASAAAAVAPPENQPPKRKGGRKPIYATSEERKQRNRQAQAAFRERRTEYIKQLEEAIRVHEQNLANLQTAHRHAAEECLMLRYKNSLLERILLEKGIDVQSELQAKTGGPNLGPTHMAPSLVQPPPIQRTILNRHHARRSTAGMTVAPKIEPGVGVGTILPPTSLSTASTPKARPSASSPTSYGMSPNPTGPADQQMTGTPAPPIMQHPMKATHGRQMSQVAMVPAMTQHQLQQQQQQHRQQQHQQQQQQHQHQQVMSGMHHGSGDPGHTRGGSIGGSTPFYQTPASFAGHIEQLEQGFQSPDNASMMDDMTSEASRPGPGRSSETPLSSPITTGPPQGHHFLSAPLPPHHPSHQHLQNQTIGGGEGAGPAAGPRENAGLQYPGSITQMLEGDFDFDPFGLSASMAFPQPPTPFSFDTSSMR